MAIVPKVYCEHGALTSKLKALQKSGRIELVHFPVDLTRSRSIHATAAPSKVRWQDLGLSWDESSFPWDQAVGSEKFVDILDVIGRQNRRDALHVDSAYKTGCACLVSADRDILNVRERLFDLLALKVFSPEEDTLYVFLRGFN